MDCFWRDGWDALLPDGPGAWLQAGAAAPHAAAQLPSGTLPGAFPNGPEAADAAPDPLLAALADWLAARWLPAPHWTLDPSWLGHSWPEVHLPPAQMGVLLSLVSARQACRKVLDVDPALPDGARKLACIVTALNRQVERLRVLDADPHPWQALAQRDAHASTVLAASEQGLLAPAPDAAPPTPHLWRELLRNLKALAPLVAIGQMQDMDFQDPQALGQLSATVRALGRVTLPALDDLALVLRVIARNSAMARLQASLGMDMLTTPFADARAAVGARTAAALRLVPAGVRLRDGALLGMPAQPPNPGLLLNDATVQAARRLTPATLDQLRWQVPAHQDLAVLTVGATVAALAESLASLGLSKLR